LIGDFLHFFHAELLLKKFLLTTVR